MEMHTIVPSPRTLCMMDMVEECIMEMHTTVYSKKTSKVHLDMLVEQWHIQMHTTVHLKTIWADMKQCL